MPEVIVSATRESGDREGIGLWVRALRLANSGDRWFLSVASELGSAMRRYAPTPGPAVRALSSPPARPAAATLGAHRDPAGQIGSFAAAEASLAGFFVSQIERVAGPCDPADPPMLLSHEQIAKALECTVRRFVSVDGVKLDPSQEAAAEPASDHVLCAPLAFRDAFLGALRVWRGPGSSPFNAAEHQLLRAIAAQASLAFAFSLAAADIEDRRRFQLAASRSERQALIETVAAEVADEVRLPINFFRSVFRRDAPRAALDREELDIGVEELDRLERLAAQCRGLVRHKLDRRAVDVPALVGRAHSLAVDPSHPLELDTALAHYRLRCDPFLITHMVAHLLSSSFRAVAGAGRVGVAWGPADLGHALTVWDTGPAITGDPARVFYSWAAPDSDRGGVGLAMVRRIARAHGWSIDALSAAGRTSFTVLVPGSDVERAPELRAER